MAGFLSPPLPSVRPSIPPARSFALLYPAFPLPTNHTSRPSAHPPAYSPYCSSLLPLFQPLPTFAVHTLISFSVCSFLPLRVPLRASNLLRHAHCFSGPPQRPARNTRENSITRFPLRIAGLGQFSFRITFVRSFDVSLSLSFVFQLLGRSPRTCSPSFAFDRGTTTAPAYPDDSVLFESPTISSPFCPLPPFPNSPPESFSQRLPHGLFLRQFLPHQLGPNPQILGRKPEASDSHHCLPHRLHPRLLTSPIQIFSTDIISVYIFKKDGKRWNERTIKNYRSAASLIVVPPESAPTPIISSEQTKERNLFFSRGNCFNFLISDESRKRSKRRSPEKQ